MGDGGARRRRGDDQPHGLHGRGRGRARVHGRQRAHDRRPGAAAPGTGRDEAHLQARGVAVASESYPEDLLYHREHDWARIEGDEAVLGVTWYAVDSLGELVHYEPPVEGAT